MFYQLDEPQQNQPSDELQISLNLKDPQEPQWLDHSTDRMMKKKSQKVVQPSEEPVNFVLEELKEELERSKQKMTKNVLNKIKGKVQELQYGVFVGETTSNKDEYLGALYKHTSPNTYIKQVSQKKTQEINDTVLQTHHQIQKQIHRDSLKLSNRSIPKSKEHLKLLENEDQYKLIQLKQGEIKHKIGSLKKQFENVTIKNKLKNMINSLQDEHLGKNYYSIEHPRTKEAEQFIRSIQASKMDHVNKMKAHAAMVRQNDEDRRKRQQYLKEQQRQERKTRLQEYYQSKLMKKMQQKQKEKAKKLQYQQWVKSFQRQKPLELQRQQQFKMKVIIPELEERHKKLMTIKAEHRPIDPQQIAEHQEKYLQFKRDNDLRKRAQIELKREEQQQQQKQIDQRMFKGKYRYLVLEQMVEEKYPVSSKQIEQSKRDRIRAYNDNVRSIHQDTMMVPDQRQKIQAETISNQKFVKRVRNMNGSMSVTKQPENFQKEHSSEKGERKEVQDRGHYKQGIQNLAFLRSIIREQKEKQQDNPPIIHLIEQKQIIKPKGYLQVQRQKTSHKKKLEAISKDIRKTAPSANSQIGAIKAKAEMVDQNLRRKQLHLRNIQQGKFQGGKVMQQDYVNAIKAKIHMLNQFN